jgi:hypothetical protein
VRATFVQGYWSINLSFESDLYRLESKGKGSEPIVEISTKSNSYIPRTILWGVTALPRKFSLEIMKCHRGNNFSLSLK